MDERKKKKKEYELKGIVQEIEARGRRQYRIQFEGFTKLSDARWWTEKKIENKWPDLIREWKRKKETYGVTKREGKWGLITSIKKGK